MTINRLQRLNDTEKAAIEAALDQWIDTHTEKQSWAQKIIRDEMLDKLFWASDKL